MRSLAFLKFIPLAFLITVIAVWVVSVFFGFGLVDGDLEIHIFDGTIHVGTYLDNLPFEPPNRFFFNRIKDDYDPLGSIKYERAVDSILSTWDNPTTNTKISCPFCCLVTLLLPIAVGAITRFRFQLWMLLAWMTLVAAECGYYCWLPRLP